MTYDFKKEFRELYRPSAKPHIIDVPEMKFIAVRGKGDPNEEDGEYAASIAMLYPLAYTLKMSYRSDYKIAGFFEYVVPPLEGFWWQEGIEGFELGQKEKFCWISLIRVPDFVTEGDFSWAVKQAGEKKDLDLSKVEFLKIREGLCVQAMHTGPYDAEPATVAEMTRYAEENGYTTDINDKRHHHEIYLSDPRRTASEKLKTVIRHPVRLL